MAKIKTGLSAAWQQFLVARKAMLDEYDRAHMHAKSQPVKIHHGVVGESGVRDWLTNFLPKKFGVTSGYIRSQDVASADNQSAHFDVIIYDKMESPILWIEENKGVSENGRSRIIPIEFVRGVIEVKAAFNSTFIQQAVSKLKELAPFMAGIENPDVRYPKYLRPSTVLGILCFEIRQVDANGWKALETVRELALPRPFYGVVVLRGEGIDPDWTALIKRSTIDMVFDGISLPRGLLHHSAFTPSKAIDGQHWLAHLAWSDTHFAEFAFELLARLNGTFTAHHIPSFHGLDFSSYV